MKGIVEVRRLRKCPEFLRDFGRFWGETEEVRKNAKAALHPLL
jgi:hypothetical protein